MIDQDEVLEQCSNAQQLLKEGLQSFEDTQADLFRHLESMAAHVVALEAILMQTLREQPVDAAAVVHSIKERVLLGGVASESANPAVEIALKLLAASRPCD